MSAPLCTVCHGTGSKSGFLDGDLDCTACDAVEERIGLRALLALRPSADDSFLWKAYSLGKAVGIGQERAAAPVVPVAAQPVVPEGWKLVPEAPTPKMVDATWNDSLDGMSHNARNKKIYGAMLAAAPQPAASVTDVAKDAERYSWLRQNNIVANVRFHFANGESPYLYSEPLDQAIDAAIAAQQGEKTK